jgi:hypothetical protein
MTYSTGNAERDKRLRRAIGEVMTVQEQPTLEAVAKNLPQDFAVDADELNGMLTEMGIIKTGSDDGPPEPPPQIAHAPMIAETPTGEKLPPPETLNKIALPDRAGGEQPHDPPVTSTPEAKISEGQARAMVTAANARLSRAREAMLTAQNRLKARRADLSAEVREWQLLFKPMQQSREDLVRQHIAANQQYKQDVADGKIAPPRQAGPRGRSYIDRTSGRGGNANDFARRYQGEHASLGGAAVHKGARRNAYPSQYQGRTVKQPSDA